MTSETSPWEKWSKCLSKFWEELVNQLPVKKVLDALVTHHIISFEELGTIKKQQTSPEEVRELLSILQRTNSNHHRKVIDIFTKEMPDIGQKMAEYLGYEISTPGLPTTAPPSQMTIGNTAGGESVLDERGEDVVTSEEDETAISLQNPMPCTEMQGKYVPDIPLLDSSTHKSFHEKPSSLFPTKETDGLRKNARQRSMSGPVGISQRHLNRKISSPDLVGYVDEEANSRILHELEQLRNEVKDMRAELKDVKLEVKELGSKITDIKGEFREMGNKFTEMKGAFKELKSKTKGMKNQIEVTTTELTDIKQKLSDFEAKFWQKSELLADEINDMEGSLSEMKRQSNAIEESVDILKSQISTVLDTFEHMSLFLNDGSLSLVIGDRILRDISGLKLHQTQVECQAEARVSDLLNILRTINKNYSRIVICVGTNDCSCTDFSIDMLVKQYTELVNVAKNKVSSPDLVSIASVPPRSDNAWFQRNVDTLNKHLLFVAENTGVTFINNCVKFKSGDGEIIDCYFHKDGIHLTTAGVKKIAEHMALNFDANVFVDEQVHDSQSIVVKF